MTDVICPRCNGGEETYWIKQKLAVSDRGAKFYHIDGDQRSWYICQDCGLLWVPKSGQRNRSLDILD